jgi:hypothetical protein
VQQEPLCVATPVQDTPLPVDSSQLNGPEELPADSTDFSDDDSVVGEEITQAKVIPVPVLLLIVVQGSRQYCRSVPVLILHDLLSFIVFWYSLFWIPLLPLKLDTQPYVTL